MSQIIDFSFSYCYKYTQRLKTGFVLQDHIWYINTTLIYSIQRQGVYIFTEKNHSTSIFCIHLLPLRLCTFCNINMCCVNVNLILWANNKSRHMPNHDFSLISMNRSAPPRSQAQARHLSYAPTLNREQTELLENTPCAKVSHSRRLDNERLVWESLESEVLW